MAVFGGKGPMIIAVLWTETAIATLFVVARCYTRRVILRSLGLDDALLIITLVSINLSLSFQFRCSV